MAVLKCTMCGGDLDINSDVSVGVCQYCGSTITIPKQLDKRGNLYNRANALRQNNEFDKAIAAYEDILKEDYSDAEAHWGLVLCKFGIEYVEDPNTGDRVPTCHRLQYDSILLDSDYQAAISSADPSSKVVYESEARRIDRIQKRILEISAKEEPFDVFICYKETDDAGNRSEDSVIAQEMYYELTRRGYKVFYARKTLEGKLGSAYEPVIFAALNSSRAMVVLGTRPDHFTSVWVKNEWSRYRELIKKGQEKTLIPAYRGFSAYELPAEFASLQALDMTRLGFMHDLLDGLDKILKRQQSTAKVVNQTDSASLAGSGNFKPLLDRAFICLEDGDFKKADELLEQVLNTDPRSAQAYIGKLMVELKISHEQNLANHTAPLDASSNYQKAVRFADEAYAKTIQGYNQTIKDRLENERREQIYQAAVRSQAVAKSEKEFRAAGGMYSQISGYKDADALAAECKQLATAARQEAERIAEEERIQQEKRIEEFRIRDEKRRLEAERQAEIKRIENEKRRKRIRIFLMIGTSVAVVTIAFIVLLNTVIIPASKYNQADQSFQNGQYAEAAAIYSKLGNYKDSASQIQEAKYKQANQLITEKKYVEAAVIYSGLGNYKDSASQIQEARYKQANQLITEKKYVEAAAIYSELGDYKDSPQIIDQYKYLILAQSKPGDIVIIGRYEQDNDPANGKETIAWRVLAIKNGKALLISEKNLDCQPYNKKNRLVTWATCTLRGWLNTTFINEAFPAEDQTRIMETELTNDDNPEYGTDGGNATRDKIFLLSIAEANQYFADDAARVTANTPYAVARGAYNNGGKGWWWGRSPGRHDDYAAYVLGDGSVRGGGSSVSSGDGAVRPALWVNLQS